MTEALKGTIDAVSLYMNGAAYDPNKVTESLWASVEVRGHSDVQITQRAFDITQAVQSPLFHRANVHRANVENAPGSDHLYFIVYHDEQAIENFRGQAENVSIRLLETFIEQFGGERDTMIGLKDAVMFRVINHNREDFDKFFQGGDE